MTWFASVGQLRIQSYLSRTRHLWGRRGASLVLSQLNRPEAIEQLLKLHGCRPNPHAMDVDGVVDLVGDSRADVLAAARAVAYEFRARLPGVISSIRFGEGLSDGNHVGADYAAFLGAEDGALESKLVAPAAAEYPPLALCQECGVDPAEREDFDGYGNERRLCGDCFERLPAEDERRWASVVWDVNAGTLFNVEAQLLDELNQGLDEQDHVHGPKDFAHLAGWGGPRALSGGRVTDNHLALINADGNGFGALFEGLRRHLCRVAPDELPAWLEQMQILSKAAHDATKDALVDATRELRECHDAGRRTVCPVVPHILGGDDLLVSVPARYAWRFVQSFVAKANEGFRAAREVMREFVARHPGSDGSVLEIPELSMSAGVVLCGYAFPFGDQVALSERVLREAKDRVDGRASSVAWHDVTWEGSELKRRRRAWLVESPTGHGGSRFAGIPSLRDGRALIDRAAAMPQSGRQTLWRLLSRNPSDPEVAYSELQRQAFRHGDVKELREAVPEGCDDVVVIRDALSLARWW